ncbi:hypothetical protein [Mesorhizobium sp. LSJC264A00]|uniref:hypothetical protein n=1 Tax=unclassified Mesorhizobium TaxID=325217 RepID=UPI0003CF4B75|nr:hypothetical protein [Mesorhizobium sp. LSJC264A00]ESX23302.1 hypothetical protein X767_15910 [Mesorhizobium sp. LSJC264A00]
MRKLSAVDRPEFITVRQAAILAQRSPSWIREWVACGRLAAERRDRLIFVDQADVDALIAKTIRRRPARRGVPHLRLVVDNT